MPRISRRAVIKTLGVLAQTAAALAAYSQRRIAMSEEILASTASGAVTLDREVTRVRLAPGASAAPLSRRIAEGGSGRRYFLVLSDLRAAAQPGVVYDIYLGLQPGANPGPNDPRLVGTLNFFGVAPPNTTRNLSRSYDVTQTVRALQSQGLLDGPLTVTIVPGAGSSADNAGQPVAQPSIGRIALMAQ
jgi:hypothetical protein